MSVTPTRTRNPRGQGDRLRVDLLDAAAELIAEQGTLASVSLRAVAARAGVSPTSVYRHFDDHDDLLEAAVLHCWDSFDAALERAADPDLDPFDEFRAIGSAYVDFARAQPGKYRVLFTNHFTAPSPVSDAGMAVFGKLVDRVTAMLTANDDDRDPTFVATQVHTWIHGIVDLCACAGNPYLPPVEDQLSDLALRLGLVPREPTSR